MSVFLAGMVVAAFSLILSNLGLGKRVREVQSRALQSFTALRDPTKDDDEKERVLRDQAKRLVFLTGFLSAATVLALASPLLVVWILDRMGLASLGEVLEVLRRVDFLLVISAVGALVFLVRSWIRRP